MNKTILSEGCLESSRFHAGVDVFENPWRGHECFLFNPRTDQWHLIRTTDIRRHLHSKSTFPDLHRWFGSSFTLGALLYTTLFLVFFIYYPG